MKFLYFSLLAVLLSGCIKTADIEFSGIVPGVKSGVFIVKTPGDSSVFGENIKDGKFAMTKRPLKYPGYYMMNITDDANADSHSPFEIYLEDGKYTIETEAGKLYKYPKITSPSKTQQELSAFYALVDKAGIEGTEKVNRLNEEVKAKEHSISGPAYTKLLNELSEAQIAMLNISTTPFKQFIAAYPNSEISAHIMSRLSYDEDPVAWYALYNKLSATAKNSDDGKEVGDRLAHLVKLVVGATAPAIVGKTPEGKTFDPKTLNSKVIVVEFWKAGNDLSRQNHQYLKDMLGRLTNAKLGAVSISLDSKPDWWASGISQDGLTWPQVSDLKGDESPNAANWNITQIPTYYLLNSKWQIIERNIDIGRIEFETNDYLKKHGE